MSCWLTHSLLPRPLSDLQSPHLAPLPWQCHRISVSLSIDTFCCLRWCRWRFKLQLQRLDCIFTDCRVDWMEGWEDGGWPWWPWWRSPLGQELLLAPISWLFVLWPSGNCLLLSVCFNDANVCAAPSAPSFCLIFSSSAVTSTALCCLRLKFLSAALVAS